MMLTARSTGMPAAAWPVLVGPALQQGQTLDGVAAAPPVARMPTAGLVWLMAGGLFCTAGALVDLIDARLRYAHLAWHLVVMAGSACHFRAVLWHAIA